MTSKQIQWSLLGLALVVAFAWYQYRKPRFVSGEDLPVFSAIGIQGDTIRSTDFKGNYLLVQFWGSWCGPCRAENPQLAELYNKHHQQGFDILSIGIETSRERWLKAIANDDMNWPHHTADMARFDGELAKLFNVHSIPTTFLVNPDGKIIAVNAHPAKLDQILSQKSAGH